MSGLDHLLAKSLDMTIRKNLGSQAVKKIEDRLFEKFGISLTQSMEEFDKLDLVLREFFGKGADGLEMRFFENIFQIKTKKSKENWYSLADSDINSVILQAFGDTEKKKILESVVEQPKIIADIIKECNLPQTSGYRKINALIDDGLLYVTDHVIKENKKINQYACVFSNLRINIEKNKVSVDIQLSNFEQKNSTVLQTIKIQ